jgi:hypothetical protein
MFLHLFKLVLAALLVLWAHLGQQRLVPSVDIDQCQHRKRAVSVLCQAPVAHFGKAPNALEREKWMLYLGPSLALGVIDRLVAFSQRRVAVGALVGEVFGLGRFGFERLVLAYIGAVAIQTGLTAVQ